MKAGEEREKEEKLLHAIGELPEDMVTEAEEYQPKRGQERGRRVWFYPSSKFAAVACAILLAVGAVAGGRALYRIAVNAGPVEADSQSVLENGAMVADGDGGGDETDGQIKKTDSGADGGRQDTGAYDGSRIPVYSAKEKKRVKKYLAGLPDKYLSFQEAKDLGIIRNVEQSYLLKGKEEAYFTEQWIQFCQKIMDNRTCQEIANSSEERHDITCEAAIVIVAYTVEGDPVYDYISYINGEYYWYSDSSKDQFGGGYLDGSYRELRIITEKTKKRKRTGFYLVADSGMTDREIIKMLWSDQGYDEEKFAPVFWIEGEREDLEALRQQSRQYGGN